jgi:hypothetical protein
MQPTQARTVSPLQPTTRGGGKRITVRKHSYATHGGTATFQCVSTLREVRTTKRAACVKRADASIYERSAMKRIATKHQPVAAADRRLRGPHPMQFDTDLTRGYKVSESKWAWLVKQQVDRWIGYDLECCLYGSIMGIHVSWPFDGHLLNWHSW